MSLCSCVLCSLADCGFMADMKVCQSAFAFLFCRSVADVDAAGNRVQAVLSVVDLGEEDRLPEPAQAVIAGITLPLFRLNPFPASAPIKAELLLSQRKERL